MRIFSPIMLAALLWCVAAPLATAQESDFEVKRNYELAYTTIRQRIDSATTVAELDSLLLRLNGLETQYAVKSRFLDKALYPDDFAGSIHKLRQYHGLTYERVYLIQTQGIAIKDYEARLTALEGRIDSLTTQNRQLLGDLKAARQSLTQLRERVRRLSAAMLSRDRLIFALVDTIFLPYDKDMQQVSDVQKEAIARKLLKSNIVARVYDIAADNVKFMEATQLQGKDFKGMFDQVQQFKTKWSGLREKLNAVAQTADAALLEKESSAPATTPGAAPGRKPATGKPRTPAAAAADSAAAAAQRLQLEQPAMFVDTALTQWEAGLQKAFWAGLAREFSSKGAPLQPFSDGAGFTAAIQSYVDSAKKDGRDVSAFVKEVWKEKVDKEWREVLERDEVLGKAQYASLDKMVSEIGEKQFDLKFLLYIVLAAAAALLIYWVFGRKPKPAAAKK
jgi:hypothetical protein